MVQDLGSSKDPHRIHLRIEPLVVRAFTLESLGIGKNIVWAVLQNRYVLTVLCPQFLLSMLIQIELAVGKCNLAAILDIPGIELALMLIRNKARQSGFGQSVHPLIACKRLRRGS
jgi:hypothetical protein